ncbi:hypothetical protein [Malonomonas rubra]|uniref:hypothetical protein n=1 Tax=Malonomonas rubra TaxID=57040 RepID=UPI0026E95674|nr:hypothetical protein [Malonomonas rubra]
MLPRKGESEGYRANKSAKKRNYIKEKAIDNQIWQTASEALSRRESFSPPCACHLCGLVAFLVLSLAVITLATNYPEPSAQLRIWLDKAPPELYLNISLAVYIISEFFYILLRSGQDGSRKFALK